MKTKKTGLTDPKAGGMIAKLEGSLSQLASLSKSLNEASDQLSKQLTEIESALNAHALGIRAWSDEPLLREVVEGESDGKKDTFHHVHTLGYGKYNDKWGFLVVSGVEEFWSDDDIEVRFLRDCSREIRLKAMDKIPELLDILAKELARTTQEAVKKAAQAKEIAAALSKKQR